MTAFMSEVHQFLLENIQTEQDLNLENVTHLLNAQHTKQTQLDLQLKQLEVETKAIILQSLNNAKCNKDMLNDLGTSLEATDNDIDQFVEETAIDKSAIDLFEHLNTLENKLKKVDIAKSYLKALLLASELSTQAMEYVQNEPEKSIEAYVQLVRFERYIQDHGTKQYGELTEHLHKVQTRLQEDLTDILTKEFKDQLDGLSWPIPIRPPYGPQLKSKIKSFERAFQNLLLLQDASCEGIQESDNSAKDENEVSLPISIMLEGLSLRFRYHFATSKPTNRIDKPEWYLTHVKNTIAAHIPFIMTTIQPIFTYLEGSQKGTERRERIKRKAAKDQFIHGFLQDVYMKLQKTMPKLLSQPNLLSHTIHQVLHFDKSLQEEFAFDGYTLISDVILKNANWFNSWFDAEKAFAQTRYNEIMLDGQAFDIYAEDSFEKPAGPQEDISAAKLIKRTRSTVRLINLLENVTNAYQLVSDLEQKLNFFVDIQLDLLGQYQKRISAAIDSFEALSLIRSVPVPGALPEAVTGVMTANEAGGIVTALDRLYKWWTSCRSIIQVLKDWTNEEFFITMQYDIMHGSDSIQSLVTDLELSHQANNCMIHLSQLMHSQQEEGLFSAAITAFEQLNLRIEKIIVKMAMKEWTIEAKKYAKKDDWWQPSSSGNDGSMVEISAELYRPLQDLRLTWNYLYSVLPQSYFLNIYRRILKEIEDWYWKNIITTTQFSAAGALQLEADLKQGLWKIGQRYVSKPENFTKRLKEAVLLLTLPFPSPRASTTHDNIMTDLPSWDVLMKALADPTQLDSIQATLKKMDVEFMSNGQIREVLRRRNDMLESWN
ncbi:TIP-1 family-domain-containing protein [Mycotypha africana]|uniref:TIP-1 family-domain-containing protein n=1 Tax=Mycotypha africana TaxID=64632 RepID=UPI0023015B8A|nr:TIP-1 family-domain-containing protein [Mycotypha africana]KAI8979648.1 TIP-1 family-domain-containing protein [Mycotypha africana]